MKPTLTAPRTKRLKLKYDKLLTILLQFCFQLQLAPLQQGGHRRHGKAVQVEPMKSMLKAPEAKRLKLKYDKLLSKFAFKFNLRHYATELMDLAKDKVRRCRLNRRNPI